MKEYEKCIVNGKEQYLNDMLVDLPYSDEDFFFIYKGKQFKAFPKNAKEFCMDYSRDTYSQSVEVVNDSIEGLFNFMNSTGDIIVFIGDYSEVK